MLAKCKTLVANAKISTLNAFIVLKIASEMCCAFIVRDKKTLYLKIATFLPLSIIYNHKNGLSQQQSFDFLQSSFGMLAPSCATIFVSLNINVGWCA